MIHPEFNDFAKKLTACVKEDQKERALLMLMNDGDSMDIAVCGTGRNLSMLLAMAFEQDKGLLHAAQVAIMALAIVGPAPEEKNNGKKEDEA